MNELEIRAQAAYGAVAMRLSRANDEIANVSADLAVANAKVDAYQQTINELQAKILALETPKP